MPFGDRTAHHPRNQSAGGVCCYERCAFLKLFGNHLGTQHTHPSTANSWNSKPQTGYFSSHRCIMRGCGQGTGCQLEADFGVY